MLQLEFEIKGQHISRIDKLEPVADAINYLTAHFNFITNEWQGINKFVIFWKHGVPIKMIIPKSGIVEIPMECTSEGHFYVSCFGGNRITNDKAEVYVTASGFSEAAEDPTHPPDDFYNKVLTIAQSVRDDANAGLFNGEPGTPGEVDYDKVIRQVINDNDASKTQTYSSEKINSMISVVDNSLKLQLISTEEELEALLENFNSKTIYLILNSLLGAEEYPDDCYVEVMFFEVAENGNITPTLRMEALGSTNLSRNLLVNYYTKVELDDLGVKDIPAPLMINGYILSRVAGDSLIPHRSVKFFDASGNYLYSNVSNNEMRFVLPIKNNVTYQEQLTILPIEGVKPLIEIENNKEYRLSTAVTDLIINLPDELPDRLECSINLKTGDSITLTADSSIKWVGDDCSDGAFTPSANRFYEISIKNLGYIDGVNQVIARVGAF